MMKFLKKDTQFELKEVLAFALLLFCSGLFLYLYLYLFFVIALVPVIA